MRFSTLLSEKPRQALTEDPLEGLDFHTPQRYRQGSTRATLCRTSDGKIVDFGDDDDTVRNALILGHAYLSGTLTDDLPLWYNGKQTLTVGSFSRNSGSETPTQNRRAQARSHRGSEAMSTIAIKMSGITAIRTVFRHGDRIVCSMAPEVVDMGQSRRDLEDFSTNFLKEAKRFEQEDCMRVVTGSMAPSAYSE